jgi:hypothetical protein
MVISAAAFAFAAMGCATAPESAPPPKAKDLGPPWRSLFNRQNVDQWKTVGTAHWRVDNGDILGTQDGDASRAGLLVTKDPFKNFELTLDFNIDEHGKYNSGVYLRNDPDAHGQTGYQVNIGRGVVGEYCGGVYRNGWLAKGDVNDAIRKPNAWNTLHILADGPHIVVDLNGARVVDYSDPNPEPKLLEAGAIALQTYGAEGHPGWVRFRNVKIRELPGESTTQPAEK